MACAPAPGPARQGRGRPARRVPSGSVVPAEPPLSHSPESRIVLLIGRKLARDGEGIHRDAASILRIRLRDRVWTDRHRAVASCLELACGFLNVLAGWKLFQDLSGLAEVLGFRDVEDVQDVAGLPGLDSD